MHFVYLKVPMVRPWSRSFEGLHAALENALTDAGLGALVSWGTSWPSAHATAHAPGQFHRIDVELQDLERGLSLLREVLSHLGVPVGTELHFNAGTPAASARQQLLSGEGWQPVQASTGTHRPPEPPRVA